MGVNDSVQNMEKELAEPVMVLPAEHLSADDELIEPVKAVQAETGRRVARATCYRWMLRGSHGVILQSWMLGGRRLTNRRAVRRFLHARSRV